jgi:hypothetical protein
VGLLACALCGTTALRASDAFGFLGLACDARSAGAHHVNGSCVERGLDMSGVEFLDHFHARAAVLRDLINVCAFHQAHADVSVTKAVRGPPVSVAIKLQLRARENPIEQLDVIAVENRVGGLWIFGL